MWIDGLVLHMRYKCVYDWTFAHVCARPTSEYRLTPSAGVYCGSLWRPTVSSQPIENFRNYAHYTDAKESKLTSHMQGSGLNAHRVVNNAERSLKYLYLYKYVCVLIQLECLRLRGLMYL